MTKNEIKKHLGKPVLVQHEGAETAGILHAVTGSGDYVEVGFGQLLHRDKVLKVLPAPAPAEPSKGGEAEETESGE